MMNLSATRDSRRRCRRGAAYVLVLSTGVLLSVVGLGVLSVSRAGARTAQQAADLDEAAVLAESAVAWGLATVKSEVGWRSAYANNVESGRKAFGRGEISFKFVDEADGNLANGAGDVRVYGVGRAGAAARAYSVALVGSGAALDSLRNPLQAGAGLTVNSNLTVTGGPLSANGTLSVSGGVTVSGDVEGTAVSVAGTVTGGRATLAAPRALPQASAFDTYKAMATVIPFASIPGGTITGRVISAASNPWGAANPAGVYYVRVPPTGTLTIRTSRIVGTLIVEMDSGGRLITSQAFAWDPPRADYPSLVVKATTGSSVSLGGANTPLNEALLGNFNPPGTPNASGVTDNDTSDSYPAEFHGLLHLVGTGYPTTLTNHFNLKGSLIAEGTVTVNPVGVKLALDPVLAANPPAGYTAATVLNVAPGTWRWEPTP